MRFFSIFFLSTFAAFNAQATSFETAFDKAMNFRNSCGHYIKSTGAEEIATAVANDSIRLNEMLNTYYKTCEFDRSMKIALEVKSGRSSLQAFESSLNYRNKCGHYINSTGAEQIAAAVAIDSIRLNEMLNTYYKTCEFDRSMKMATDVKAGRSNLQAFESALNYRNKCGHYINSTGAEQIAAAVATGQFELNTMLNFYYKTCEFDRSMRLAKTAKGSSSEDEEKNENSSSVN